MDVEVIRYETSQLLQIMSFISVWILLPAVHHTITWGHETPNLKQCTKDTATALSMSPVQSCNEDPSKILRNL